jgi:hypothetical protein
MFSFIQKTKGAIALTATVILTMVIAIISLSIAFMGISSRLNAFNLIRSEEVFIKTDGCAEEALIRLNRDNSYIGGSYNVDSMECTVAVTGSGDERNLNIMGEGDGYTHDFTIDVLLAPDFAIADWNE